MVNFKEDEALNTLNHSCAHLMAQAIRHLYPQAKFWVGPVVAEGFYYDVDPGETPIKEADLPAIESKMALVSVRVDTTNLGAVLADLPGYSDCSFTDFCCDLGQGLSCVDAGFNGSSI